LFLPDMTWQEVNGCERSTIVVAPFGAMEQHSIHLPLKTDTLIAEEIARRLDASCGNRLLVLPTLWLGFSPHHMSFSGTLTASASTYIELAKQVLGSIAQAGFGNLLILNSHGGNAAILEVVLAEFQSKHPKSQTVLVTYWNAAVDELQRIRESPIGGMGHACELETSLVLAVRPDLVRAAKLAPDGMGSRSRFLYRDMLVPGVVSTWWNPAESSKHGGEGDPTSASAEKGELFFLAIVRRLVEVVQEMSSGGFLTRQNQIADNRL
jgi:creatinine amidohydrolase